MSQSRTKRRRRKDGRTSRVRAMKKKKMVKTMMKMMGKWTNRESRFEIAKIKDIQRVCCYRDKFGKYKSVNFTTCELINR